MKFPPSNAISRVRKPLANAVARAVRSAGNHPYAVGVAGTLAECVAIAVPPAIPAVERETIIAHARDNPANRNALVAGDLLQRVDNGPLLQRPRNVRNHGFSIFRSAYHYGKAPLMSWLARAHYRLRNSAHTLLSYGHADPHGLRAARRCSIRESHHLRVRRRSMRAPATAHPGK